jgi:hypothetical protein
LAQERRRSEVARANAKPAWPTLSITALAEMERMTILGVFEHAHGDKALAGRMLDISRAFHSIGRYYPDSHTQGRHFVVQQTS